MIQYFDALNLFDYVHEMVQERARLKALLKSVPFLTFRTMKFRWMRGCDFSKLS